MKLSNYKPMAARKVIVYGPPKTGKTELVGALAKHGFKLWWFDLEDGVKTLLRPDSAAAGYLDNIELFKIPDSVTEPIASETIYKVIKSANIIVCHTHGVVNCVKCAKSAPELCTPIDVTKFGPQDILVIDPVSQLADSIQNFVMRTQIAKDAENAKPGWDEYYKNGFLMERIFSHLKQTNYHVIAISHGDLVTMDDKRKVMVPIGGTSNFSKTFAKNFDDVVYTEFVNGKYRVYSAAEQNSNAIIGSRSGKKLTEGKGLIELFT